MLWRTPHDELISLSKYDRIAIYLFRRLTAGMLVVPPGIDFTLDDIRAAMDLAVRDDVVDKSVKNAPDIKYTYDARRELPPEIEQCGPVTWLQRGKGLYTLRRTRRKNIIDSAELLARLGDPQPHVIVDHTTPFIAALLGNDEQAVFTRVRNCGLLNTFLGYSVWPIQGHHRTTVSYGQIEIDEVQAGVELDGTPVIVPISGKGGQDKLSWSQALNLNTYAGEKPPTTGYKVRSIGLWRDAQNTIWIVEFSPHRDIDEIEIVNVRRYAFKVK